VLHDGFLCGVWRIEGDRDSAVLTITSVERLPKRAMAALASEGRRLLRFAAADAAGYDVRFVRR